MLKKDPAFADEVLGEQPALVGQEAFVLDLYDRQRIATPPELGVDPALFVTLYERIYGPTDPELLVRQLSVLNEKALGLTAERRDRRAKEREREGKDGKK